eukprot:5150770-Amphidinium_carterae.1
MELRWLKKKWSWSHANSLARVGFSHSYCCCVRSLLTGYEIGCPVLGQGMPNLTVALRQENSGVTSRVVSK